MHIDEMYSDASRILCEIRKNNTCIEFALSYTKGYCSRLFGGQENTGNLGGDSAN